jgi:hypothetical protein
MYVDWLRVRSHHVPCKYLSLTFSTWSNQDSALMEEALRWKIEVEDAYNLLLKSGWESILERESGTSILAPSAPYHDLSGLDAFKWAVAVVESRAFGFKVSSLTVATFKLTIHAHSSFVCSVPDGRSLS